MGQHYLPKYYLNGFTDINRTSNICVYEKGIQQPYTTTLKSVATENNRWPKDIENRLANEIEKPAKATLDRIRNRQLISSNDKNLLSDYIIVMMQRVPKGLERMKNTAIRVIDPFTEIIKDQIQQRISKYPEKADIYNKAFREILMYGKHVLQEFPKEIWYLNLFPKAFPRLREMLRKMTWIFLTSNNDQYFLTCDNPVFFFEGFGFSNPDSEVTIPLSSSITLWATWKKYKPFQYSPIKSEIIREINRRTVSNATRYVYYSEEAYWVVNLVNKKHVRLKRIN